MIIIHVAVQVNPDSIDAFRALNHSFAATARQLAGCVTFNVYQDNDAPTAFAYYQQWETEDAFRTYQTSEAFKQHGANLGPMLSGPPNANYFTGAALE